MATHDDERHPHRMPVAPPEGALRAGPLCTPSTTWQPHPVLLPASLAFASLLVAAPIAETATIVTVDGAVQDAVGGRGAVWLSSDTKAGRILVAIDPTRDVVVPGPRVPPDAVQFAVCDDEGVLFVDARGLVAADGRRVLDAPALFSTPDPDALWSAEACGPAGARRVIVQGGILVVEPGARPRTLRFVHRARAYPGNVHRGLRAERPYAAAMSLYAPRLHDVDVDGDGDLDLVAIHEGRMEIFARTPGGLEEIPAQRDLFKLAAVSAESDLRVQFADVDRDRSVEAIIGASEGALPETSRGIVLKSARGALLSTVASSWTQPGLAVPLGAPDQRLVVARIDTSLVSLSSMVLSGSVPLTIRVGDVDALSLQAKADVRAGRMDGALPVVRVDFDGDGHADLLDLGTPGLAQLFGGTTTGFAAEATSSWTIPPFVHVVPLPSQHVVVLVGAPDHGRTRVVLLRVPKKA